MTHRIKQAQKRLQEAELDYYLVSHLPHVRYLCGYSGSNGLLLLSHTRAEFYTDGRYTEQVRTEVKGARARIPKDGNLVAEMAKSVILRGKHPRIGIQAKYMVLAAYTALKDKLSDALLVAHDELVEPLTAVKDKKEIAFIRRATKIVDEAFVELLPSLRPGVREIEAAAELEYIMMKRGSEGTPFETICASGKRSALPHGKASAKKMGKGEFVTLDFGAIVGGYCSDITRTVVLGKASARQKKIYDCVYRAQTAAVRKMRHGASTRAVDATARDIITRAGYGRRFGHGTGHGVGLEVHQTPNLSPRVDSKLAAGMVVTVEPGIYVPGFGGVRIEDDVLVTRSGYEVLTTTTKKLIEL
jgi:Xaa-Pro aminopeptidase